MLEFIVRFQFFIIIVFHHLTLHHVSQQSRITSVSLKYIRLSSNNLYHFELTILLFNDVIVALHHIIQSILSISLSHLISSATFLFIFVFKSYRVILDISLYVSCEVVTLSVSFHV
ncbi:MAG: hypothetical protein U9Q66_00555 [Patescibacteria group bacterium]|nr:hypothetical protein [Patescibacteria group bacterium]